MLRYAPPPWLIRQAGETFGRFRVARIFLTLDEYWDYRDDSFHPNHRIGRNRYAGDAAIHPYDRQRTAESSVGYLDHLDAVAAQADELLLCVRRYEHEVTRGLIARQKYEQVLTYAVRTIKLRHPNLRYLEALNESTNDHFGGLDVDAYYPFYQSFYRVANAVNAERLPGPEIGVGGPVTDKKRFHLVENFLNHYRHDPDPAKRLDFVSFHDYASGEPAARVGELRRQVDRWLSVAGLPGDMPAFITEIGTHEARHASNAAMAAGVPALLEQARRQHDLIAFPWCLYHDPDIQLWSTQHLPDGRMTPHGMAMALLALHRRDELRVDTNGVDEDGLGVYALASRDEGGLCVHLWNYSQTPARVTLRIEPAAQPDAGVRCYALDSRNNNVLADHAHPGKLTHAAALSWACLGERPIELEPYGHRPNRQRPRPLGRSVNCLSDVELDSGR